MCLVFFCGVNKFLDLYNKYRALLARALVCSDQDRVFIICTPRSYHLHYQCVDKEWCVTVLAPPEVDNDSLITFKNSICMFVFLSSRCAWLCCITEEMASSVK